MKEILLYSIKTLFSTAISVFNIWSKIQTFDLFFFKKSAGVLPWLTAALLNKHEWKQKQRKWLIWRVWSSLVCLPPLAPSSHSALWTYLRLRLHTLHSTVYIFLFVYKHWIHVCHIVCAGCSGKGVQLCNHQHLWDTSIGENGGWHVQSCCQGEPCSLRL